MRDTGDLVYLDSRSGVITFIGRKDNLIKINGKRLLLEDLELFLLTLPGVEHSKYVFQIFSIFCTLTFLLLRVILDRYTDPPSLAAFLILDFLDTGKWAHFHFIFKIY